MLCSSSARSRAEAQLVEVVLERVTRPRLASRLCRRERSEARWFSSK